MVRRRLISLVMLGLVLGHGTAGRAAPDKAPDKPPSNPPAGDAPGTPKKEEPKLTCHVITAEAPRGGRLEVSGKGFGKAPVVRIQGKAVRMIERTDDTIAVQIPRDSNGGSVTVRAEGLEAECGTLTIIGKN